MASPFDKLTESDKLRSFVDTRSFAEDLAQSNATIFEAESKALGLQDTRNKMAQAEIEKAAKDAFAKSVVVGAKDEADMLSRAQQFAANNPNYAQYVPEQLKQAGQMFEGVALSKQRALALRQQELQNQKAEAVIKSEIEYTNSTNELKSFDANRELVEKQAIELEQADNPLAFIGDKVDPNNPAQIALTKNFENEYKSAVTDAEKAERRKVFTKNMDAFQKFRTIQNEFSANTMSRYSDTLIELQNDPKVKGYLNAWWNTKTPEQRAAIDDSSVFIEFLGESSLDVNNPYAPGYEISRMSPQAMKVMNRAKGMTQARNAYNEVIKQIDPATGQFKISGLDVTLKMNALRQATELVYNSVKTEEEVSKRELEQRKLEAGIMNTEQEAAYDRARAQERSPEAIALKTIEEELKTARADLAKAETASLSAKNRVAANAIIEERKNRVKNLEERVTQARKTNPRTSVPSPS